MAELIEYRKRFSEYHAELAELEEGAYRSRGGGGTSSERDRIRSEYSDLFTIDAIEELAGARAGVAGWIETELRAIDRLRGFAVAGYVRLRAAEVDAEIQSYEADSEVEYEDQRIPLARLDRFIAGRNDAGVRRELTARGAELRDGASDLYAERLAIWKRSVVAAGYRSFAQARLELSGADLAVLAHNAERLLSKTEKAYLESLSGLLPVATGVVIDEAIDADLDNLEFHSRYDAWFTPERMATLYRELFDGFGFNPAAQSNLKLSIGEEYPSGAACFPVRVPGDIRLVVGRSGGQRAYRGFFGAAGRAQQFAWTSNSLQPEFRLVTEWGDSALSDCWSGLLSGLIGEALWLQGGLGLIESGALIRVLKLVRLAGIRRRAAGHLHELDVLESESLPDPFSAYAARLSDAMKVRFDPSRGLAGADPGFSHGNHLRGAALEAQLRDFLKTRFGARWWTSRKAGEMIIDLWNTGQRYSVEELARMIGLGELDYDWLAADLTR